jgi:hypothetical protein
MHPSCRSVQAGDIRSLAVEHLDVHAASLGSFEAALLQQTAEQREELLGRVTQLIGGFVEGTERTVRSAVAALQQEVAAGKAGMVAGVEALGTHAAAALAALREDGSGAVGQLRGLQRVQEEGSGKVAAALDGVMDRTAGMIQRSNTDSVAAGEHLRAHSTQVAALVQQHGAAVQKQAVLQCTACAAGAGQVRSAIEAVQAFLEHDLAADGSVAAGLQALAVEGVRDAERFRKEQGAEVGGVSAEVDERIRKGYRIDREQGVPPPRAASACRACGGYVRRGGGDPSGNAKLVPGMMALLVHFSFATTQPACPPAPLPMPLSFSCFAGNVPVQRNRAVPAASVIPTLLAPPPGQLVQLFRAGEQHSVPAVGAGAPVAPRIVPLTLPADEGPEAEQPAEEVDALSPLAEHAEQEGGEEDVVEMAAGEERVAGMREDCVEMAADAVEEGHGADAGEDEQEGEYMGQRWAEGGGDGVGGSDGDASAEVAAVPAAGQGSSGSEAAPEQGENLDASEREVLPLRLLAWHASVPAPTKTP